MSIRIMTEVWDTECPSHTSKLVLIALADNASDQRLCWPSIETIATKCNLTTRAVQKQIHILEKGGLLFTHRREGTSNRYTVLPLGENKGVNTVQEGGEYGSPHPRMPFTPPTNGVHPNHQESSIEPKMNQQPAPRVVFPEIPPNLKTPGFEKSWGDWLIDRKIRKKPVTPLGAGKQLKMLSKFGVDEAIRIIDNAIEKGWQGLYPIPKPRNDRPARNPDIM